ncbi:endolytic transglycosylase MltG [Candidatus Nitronereus thalassa]|uniref:Endolytic murein transglycosylase n=1 Tax=Candidatus Nitronereus thalassa TaxID=3020898 RepID=A0ABU3K3X1_9BACT|nr:endolytic transglycosylase MltG [Candidatus Nitronereus thalassa]MDT7041087.1 endolytic transglycosylase MltG [Candidatus Nitronereus thalassa]
MRIRTPTVVGSVVLLALVGGLAFLSQLQPVGNPSQRQILEIPQGASLSHVSSLLYQRQLIKSDWAFSWMGRVLGADRNIIPGEYEFHGGMAPADVLNKITKGEVVRYAVTIPEGYSIEQIAGILQAKGLADQDRFIALTKDRDFLSRLNFQVEDLEGYLFPDTYHFTRQMPPESIIQAMVTRFKQSWTEQLQARAAELGMSVHQIMTLASVIEKETGLSQERGLISGVFHNRLRKKIPLQSDPTVIYALAQFDGDLRKKDLTVDSPYNTYRFRGLPPGPIANPGEASIKAALYPVPTNYLYFVSRNDGSHQFSATLDEHNIAVKKFQLQQRQRSS